MNMSMYTVIAVAISLLAGCGSTPEEQKEQAEAEYIEEKTRTIQEYKECVENAGEDKAKLDACERLLKAVDAQGGGAMQ